MIPPNSLAEWVDLAYGAMIVRDPEGRVLLWNRRAEEIYGWSKSEALGQVSDTLLQAQYPTSCEAVDTALAEHGCWEGELVHTRRDGTRLTVLSRQAAQRDEYGTLTAILELDLDLTEQKRAQDELRTANARLEEHTAELEAIFASLPDAIYVGNENGITRCNQVALDNLGCRTIQDLQDKIPVLNERLQNRYAGTGERIRPEDEAFARALRGQPWTYEVVSRNLTTGQDIIQRSAAAPILLEGQVIGAVAINTDITEQKHIEGELRDAVRELSERETALREAIAQKEAALSERDASLQALSRARAELEQRVQERTAELVQRTAALSEKEAELTDTVAQLRDSEERFRIALAHSPIVVSNQDRDLRYTWIYNPHPGFDGTEVLGKSDLDLLPADDAARLAAIKHQVLNTEVGQRAEVRTTINGQPFYSDLAVEPLRDASRQVIGVTCVSIDITERRQTEQLLQRQSEQMRALHAMDEAILGSQSPADIAGAATRTLVASTSAIRATVTLFDFRARRRELLAVHGVDVDYPLQTLSLDDYWLLEENRLGRPGVLPDLATFSAQAGDGLRVAMVSAGIHSYAGIPLIVSGQTIGALTLGLATTGDIPQEDQDFVRQVADELAVALYNARLFDQIRTNRQELQTLTRRLVQVQEEERRVLARDTHDTSGQGLTALRMGLAMLKREGGCTETLRARIDELHLIADTVAEDLHRLSVNLRPSILDRYGLVPALDQLIASVHKQTGIEVGFLVQGPEERLPGDTETALYRIVQEATTNISRYAQATSASVIVQREGDTVRVIVEDNGKGFELDEALRKGRLGLLGMRERAEMLGGTFTIESRPGHGTTLYVDVPVRDKEDESDASDDGAAVAGIQYDELAPASDEKDSAVAELARAKALSDVLVEITAGMARQDNAADLLGFVLERSAQAIGCDYAIVGQREGDHWVVSDGYNLPASLMGQRLPDAYLPVAVRLEQTGEMTVVNGMRFEDPNTGLARKSGGLPRAAIPLMAGGKLVGVVAYAQNSAAVAFKPSEVEFLERLSGLISLAMENTKLHESEAQQRSALHTQAEQLAEANARLADERDRLRTLVTSIPDEVWFCDAAGKVMAANPAAVRGLELESTGEDFQSVPGWRDLEILTPDGQPRPLEDAPLLRALRGEEVRGQEEIILMPRTGELHYRQASGDAIRDAAGQVLGAVLVVRDVTERVRMEELVRQTSAEIERERDLLRTILNSITDEVWYSDAEGNFYLANPAAVRGFGFEKPSDTFVPVPEWQVLEIYNPDGTLRPYDEAPLLRALSGEVIPFGAEIGRRLDTGELRHRQFSAAPVHDNEGKIVGSVAAVRDVTALREAAQERERLLAELQEHAAKLTAHEEKLRAQNQRLLAAQREMEEANTRLSQREQDLQRAVAELDGILSSLPSGLIVYDRDGHIIRINGLAQGMLGYDELTWKRQVGERVASVVHLSKPDGSAYAWEEYPAIRALRGEEVSNEDVFLHLPAHPEEDFWAMMSACPIREQNGELLGAVITMTDTGELHKVSEELRQANTVLREQSEQLQAQADELREAAEMLEQGVQERTAELAQANEALSQREAALREQAELLNLTHDAILVHDLYSATIRYWNRGAEERYGWTAAEAIGQTSHNLTRTVFPEPLDTIYRQVVEKGQWEGELIHTRRDGTRFTVSSRWALKRDREGRPQAVLETSNDITLYKKSEAQREAMLRSLEESRQQLQALTRRLVAMQESERSYVADQLYNQAGQVLAALQMRLGLLEKKLQEHSAAEQWADMKTALNLAISELHALASQLRPVGLDRSALSGFLYFYVARFGREHGLAVDFSAEGAEGLRLPPEVATAVYRAVEEALANVARHAQASALTVAIGRLDDHLTISVEDNGVGFDPGTAHRQGGVGLIGMRERIEAVGGRLSIESEPGSTNVFIEVPLEAKR